MRFLTGHGFSKHDVFCAQATNVEDYTASSSVYIIDRLLIEPHVAVQGTEKINGLFASLGAVVTQ